LNSDTEESC